MSTFVSLHAASLLIASWAPELRLCRTNAAAWKYVLCRDVIALSLWQVFTRNSNQSSTAAPLRLPRYHSYDLLMWAVIISFNYIVTSHLPVVNFTLPQQLLPSGLLWHSPTRGRCLVVSMEDACAFDASGMEKTTTCFFLHFQLTAFHRLDIFIPLILREVASVNVQDHTRRSDIDTGAFLLGISFLRSDECLPYLRMD